MIQIVFYTFLFLLIIYSSLFLSGRDRRAYNVLSPNAIIIVNQKTIPIRQLALDYQPQMYISPSTPSPKLLWTWYEAVRRDKEIDIIYYQNWEDEINPNPIIHRFYWLFRSGYYGYPTYDIEFFQISISLETGKVTQLLFETSPGDDFYVTISEHIVARYIRQDDAVYQRILVSRDTGTVIDESLETVQFTGNHVLVLAQTWNHLSALILTPSPELEPLNSPLRYLSDRDYSSHKFTRKSQGDHKTEENKFSSMVARLGMFVFVLLPAAVLRYLTVIRKKENETWFF